MLRILQKESLNDETKTIAGSNFSATRRGRGKNQKNWETTSLQTRKGDYYFMKKSLS